MILRRFGIRIQPVRPHFDARALTEVAFRRDGEAMDAEAWLAGHEKVGERSLTASADGDVKDEVEQKVLAVLLRDLERLESEVDGAVLLVENESGPDHPKTRDTTTTIREPLGERLHFTYRIEPALRIGVYRPI